MTGWTDPESPVHLSSESPSEDGSGVWLLLCLRGRCRLTATDSPLLLTAPQHALLYAGGANQIVFSPETPDTELVAIAWPGAGFREITAGLPAPLTGFQQAIQYLQSAVLGAEAIPSALQYAVRELLTLLPAAPTTAPDPVQQLRCRAKLWEILALQIASFTQPASPPNPLGLTEYDQERLRFAHNYLLQHVQLPPTLPELARIVGLNEHKLKRGFKALFGKPTFAYLAEWRLLEARRLLLTDSALTAGEVAFELGYSSLPHFSAAFKQRFGLSPRALRMS